MDEQNQAELVLEKLLKRADADVGPIGIAQVAQMIARLDDDDASGQRRLTTAILSDVCIIVKLLRMANASSRGSHNIATIDQAITVLGLSSVKNAIAGLKPAGTMVDKQMATHVQAEVVAAHFCGSLAATITRHNGGRYSAQEAHVCGALQSLGRILAMVYLPEEVADAALLQADKNLSQDDAMTQILGTSFEGLAAQIATHWNFPDVLAHSVAPTQGKVPPRASANAEGWFQLCSLFSHRVTDALFRLPEGREKTEIHQNLNFFNQALSLKQDEVAQWIDDTIMETDNLLLNVLPDMSVASARTLLRKASEKVLDSLSSQDSLNKGGGDSKKPIELIHQALRMIHTEYGFDLTMLCLPSGSTGVVGVSGVGRNANSVTPKFRCAGPRLDIFQVIMSKKVDLYVADVRAPSYAKLIPEWYPGLVGAHSFMVLSLVHEGKFLGLVYGDYSEPHPAAPREKTEGAVGKWRQQLVAALQAGKPGAH
jgi:HD-like signal output (HDOD) protein